MKNFPTSFACVLLVVDLSLLRVEYVNTRIVREFILERSEVTYKNRSFGDAFVSVRKQNRTLYVMNMNVTVKRDFPQDAMMSAVLYKFDQGMYKETAMQLKKNLCDVLRGEYQLIWRDSIRKGALQNFLKQCPVKPGFYYFDNMPVPSNWPYTPAWRVRLSIKLFTKQERILELSSYVGYKEYNV